MTGRERRRHRVPCSIATRCSEPSPPVRCQVLVPRRVRSVGFGTRRSAPRICGSFRVGAVHGKQPRGGVATTDRPQAANGLGLDSMRFFLWPYSLAAAMARGVDGLNECKGLKNGLPRGVAGGRPAPGDAAPTMWLDPRAFGTSPTRRKSPVTHRNVEGTGFLAGPQKVAPWTGRFPSGPGHGWAGVGNASETHCMSEMAVERRSVGEIGPRRHGRLEGIVSRTAPVASTGTLGHGRIGPWQPEDPGLGPAGHWPHRAYRLACAACRVGRYMLAHRVGWCPRRPSIAPPRWEPVTPAWIEGKDLGLAMVDGQGGDGGRPIPGPATSISCGSGIMAHPPEPQSGQIARAGWTSSRAARRSGFGNF